MKAKKHRCLAPGHWLQAGSWGIPAALAAFACGCATQKPAEVIDAGSPALANPVRMEPGAIAVSCAAEPPLLHFDSPERWPRRSDNRAADLAHACLDPPNAPDPGLDALYSPVGLVLAPFAAAYGVLTPGRSEKSPIQVSDFRSNLSASVSIKDEQNRFRNQVLQAAGESTRRRILPLDSGQEVHPGPESVRTVLETKVEELRLERLKAKSSSFVLRIKARMILRGASAGGVARALPLEYRSGSAPFRHWTDPDALRRVVDTGYREMAKHLAEHWLSDAPGGPLLAGAGYKRAPRPGPTTPSELANHPAAPSPNSLLKVNLTSEGVGPIGVYPVPVMIPISLQRPMTKGDAVAAGAEDVNWSLDGLQNSRNLVIQLSACTAAIPMSLWKQTVGMVCGMTEKQFRDADAKLTAAAHEVQPQLELAQEVSVQLAPRAAQRVVLVKEPVAIGQLSRNTATTSERVVRLATSTVPGDLRTVLEIQVGRAALTGAGGVNPSLALCVEAEATLLRVEDGLELYRCPVHYRGEKRKFDQWAASDARLFREELQQCYREVSRTIVARLVDEEIVTPERGPRSILAKQ